MRAGMIRPAGPACRQALSRLPREEDAPPEQWARLGLEEVSWAHEVAEISANRV